MVCVVLGDASPLLFSPCNTVSCTCVLLPLLFALSWFLDVAGLVLRSPCDTILYNGHILSAKTVRSCTHVLCEYVHVMHVCFEAGGNVLTCM